MSSAITPFNQNKIVLAVNQANYKTLVSQVLANHQIFDQKDIGEFVGIPIEDYVRGKPHTIKLTLFFTNFQYPPFTARSGQPYVRATYVVPDISPASLDWTIIKNACGGKNGFNWGRFRATMNLDNGRKIQVYGGTELEAITRIKALAALSSAKEVTLTVAEELPEGKRATNKKMAKLLTRIYPNYFTVINYQKIETEDSRQYSGLNSTLLTDFRRSATKKIPLWVTNEPSTAKSQIIEALTVRGTLS